MSTTIACPKCGRISAHPQDIEEGYCGICHAWTSGPEQPVRDPLGYRPTTPAEIDNSVSPGAWQRTDHLQGES